MAFYGKVFKYQKEENFEQFVKSLGLPEAHSQALLLAKPSQIITKDGDGYQLKIESPIVNKDYKFRSGVEFEEQLQVGIQTKSVITVEGNIVTHKQSQGDNFIQYKKEFSDNQLVEVITSNVWDGVARRYFSA